MIVEWLSFRNTVDSPDQRRSGPPTRQLRWACGRPGFRARSAAPAPESAPGSAFPASPANRGKELSRRPRRTRERSTGLSPVPLYYPYMIIMSTRARWSRRGWRPTHNGQMDSRERHHSIASATEFPRLRASASRRNDVRCVQRMPRHRNGRRRMPHVHLPSGVRRAYASFTMDARWSTRCGMSRGRKAC